MNCIFDLERKGGIEIQNRIIQDRKVIDSLNALFLTKGHHETEKEKYIRCSGQDYISDPKVWIVGKYGRRQNITGWRDAVRRLARISGL